MAIIFMGCTTKGVRNYIHLVSVSSVKEGLCVINLDSSLYHEAVEFKCPGMGQKITLFNQSFG